MDYIIFIYIIFGILPSLTWLSYYLRKDVHPEPKKTILRIFLWGALITLPVFFVQLGLASLLSKINASDLITSLIYWFVVISFSEEIFKYLVIKIKIMNSPDLDEPVDVMIYMVIAALGFAALENILYLFSPVGDMSFNQLMDRTLIITFIRFIGATFLHTLCSAVVGYSLAISFCKIKTKYASISAGLFMAVLLHGLYDFSIMKLDGYLKLVVPVAIIVTLAFLVFSGFEKLKKMKSVCEANRAQVTKV
jgi:RsiW-degrading membrane proteinase PrsW (M82 family)